MYISHHGILGMHWGKQNGPPYPLGEDNHSKEQIKEANKAGIKVGKSSGKFELSNGQKTALKVLAGAGITAAVLGTSYYVVTHTNANKLISKQGEAFITNNINYKYKITEKNSNQEIKDLSHAAQIMKDSGKFKMLDHKESLEERFDNTNAYYDPKTHKRNLAGKNNCVYCAIVGYFRGQGIDIKAGSTGGEGQIGPGVVESCFKCKYDNMGNNLSINPRSKGFRRSEFTESKESASKMLLKMYGDNAEGICGVDWKSEGGHAFSWKITNGEVQFFDQQQGNGFNVDYYWSKMNPKGDTWVARLDDLEPVPDAIEKICYNK